MEQQKTLIESDFLNVKYDYIEYYVGMAKMVVYWHVHALGFEVIGYCGPETGEAEKCSYFIVKNDIKLVITSASQPSSYNIVSFVDLHGNGIKRIAIKVESVKDFFYNAIEQGAVPLSFPEEISSDEGSIERASIKLFDDNEIILINYDFYRGRSLPGYLDVQQDWVITSEDTFLTEIDHLACALRVNEMNLWEDYLNNIFRSNTVAKFDERQKNGKSTGMLLKVLQSENKKLNHVLVESDFWRKSQVQVFVDINYGAGVQHIAFSSSNILKTVELLRAKGVFFTQYPDSYYDQLSAKFPLLDVGPLRKHGVLCDVVDGAFLFQIFTAPIGDRATFFYEIVQRVNDYQGFELDNIRALFDAMELELESAKN